MAAESHFDNRLRYRDEADPRQVFLTPEYVLGPVRSAMGGSISLDPCTEPDNPTCADDFICLPRDGASEPWSGAVFVNPPYGRAREKWVDRCVEHGTTGSPVVLLMPAHTDTRTFRLAASYCDFVVMISGRLKFGVLRPNRRQVAASHPSALFCWNCDPAPLRHLGMVLIRAD